MLRRGTADYSHHVKCGQPKIGKVKVKAKPLAYFLFRRHPLLP